MDYNIKIRLYDFYLYMRSKKLNKQIKKKKADSYYREQSNCCQRERAGERDLKKQNSKGK